MPMHKGSSNHGPSCTLPMFAILLKKNDKFTSLTVYQIMM